MKGNDKAPCGSCHSPRAEPFLRAAALIKSAARRPQDTCSGAEPCASKIHDRRCAAGVDFASAPLSGFFEKASAKNFIPFLKKGMPKNFSRLRREQWGRLQYFYRLRREQWGRLRYFYRLRREQRVWRRVFGDRRRKQAESFISIKFIFGGLQDGTGSYRKRTDGRTGRRL